ncbi:hypothetical protein EIN_358690, partial [Entamoeba invadens IP1]
MNKYKNFIFKNISYTDNDRKIYSDTIPTNVIKIGNQCYSDNVEIIEIIIAKNVKIIGEYCFNRCIKLKNVIIPSSVRSISDFCFKECISLSSIRIASSIRSINDGCLSECNRLSSVNIPSSCSDWESSSNGRECSSVCMRGGGLKPARHPTHLL